MWLKNLEKNETNLINLHARTRNRKVKTMITVELCNFNNSLTNWKNQAMIEAMYEQSPEVTIPYLLTKLP